MPIPDGPDYDFDQLNRRLINAPMRFFSTLLALMSMALFIAHLASGNKLHAGSRIPMTGIPLLLFAALSTLVWTTIAVMNWRRATENSR